MVADDRVLLQIFAVEQHVLTPKHTKVQAHSFVRRLTLGGRVSLPFLDRTCVNELPCHPRLCSRDSYLVFVLHQHEC